jgi:hypothetical protein
MSRQTSAIAVTSIGIDTGKNTLHLIGLDEHGGIVLREKLARGRIRTRLAPVFATSPRHGVAGPRRAGGVSFDFRPKRHAVGLGPVPACAGPLADEFTLELG